MIDEADKNLEGVFSSRKAAHDAKQTLKRKFSSKARFQVEKYALDSHSGALKIFVYG